MSSDLPLERQGALAAVDWTAPVDRRRERLDRPLQRRGTRRARLLVFDLCDGQPRRGRSQRAGGLAVARRRSRFLRGALHARLDLFAHREGDRVGPSRCGPEPRPRRTAPAKHAVSCDRPARLGRRRRDCRASAHLRGVLRTVRATGADDFLHEHGGLRALIANKSAGALQYHDTVFTQTRPGVPTALSGVPADRQMLLVADIDVVASASRAPQGAPLQHLLGKAWIKVTPDNKGLSYTFVDGYVTPPGSATTLPPSTRGSRSWGAFDHPSSTPSWRGDLRKIDGAQPLGDSACDRLLFQRRANRMISCAGRAIGSRPSACATEETCIPTGSSSCPVACLRCGPRLR